MNSIFKICLIAFLFSAHSCSSVNAVWYSRPEKKYERTAENRAVPYAEMSGETAVFTVNSESMTHKDWNGPAFLPVIPVRTAGLDAEHLWLAFQLKAKTDPDKFSGKINIKDFVLKLDDGTSVTPETVYAYEEKESMEPRVIDFQNYPFKDGTTFSLEYPTVIYSKVKWYEFSALLQFKGRKERSPVFHLEPEKKRTVTLFDFPNIIPIGR